MAKQALSEATKELAERIAAKKETTRPSVSDSKAIVKSKRPLTYAERGRLGGLKNTQYRPERVLSITNAYIERVKDKKDELPTIEALALELDVGDDTLLTWARRFPSFGRLHKKVKVMQKNRFTQNLLGRYPTGSIFGLKALHGLVDTSRTEFTGKDGVPIALVSGMLESKIRPRKKENTQPIVDKSSTTNTTKS